MLTVIGLAAAIVAAYFVYRTANENGRNGTLWLFATLGVGFGLQIVVPLFIGIILGLTLMSTGSSVEDATEWINGIATLLGIVLLFLSFIGMWLVLRHVAKLPDDLPSETVPPPPTFDQ